MKRRATTGGKVGKARLRKTPSRRTSRGVARRGSSKATLREQLDQTKRERDEALEQQTATSEVLKVISSSPGDLGPVFRAVLENAVRLCGAKFGTMWLAEGGDRFRSVAVHDLPPALAEARQDEPMVGFGPSTGLGRAVRAKQVVHVQDMHGTTLMAGNSRAVMLVDLGGARTVMFAPMLKDNEVIGSLTIYRQEVRPFTEKQIELVQNFAAQAVIAIENTRLLNELRQRTDDLSESLEQQTATAEVLEVISSSPGELEPVFQAMLANAMRICEAKFGNLLLFDGEGFRAAAFQNAPRAYVDMYDKGPLRPGPHTGLGRLISTKELVHIEDVTTGQAYAESDPLRMATVNILKARTFLAVPMLKDNGLVGAIVIYRQEVRPFSDKQIELVRNFAAQAVIAIENTRLLSELRESLQQQTATADVLKVISRSTFDLRLCSTHWSRSAARLCDAELRGYIARVNGECVRCAARYGITARITRYKNASPDQGDFERVGSKLDEPC